MYSKMQRENLSRIRMMNVANGNDLGLIALEEMNELENIIIKMQMNEHIEREHLVEECIDTMNTVYNLLTHIAGDLEIYAVTNQKIKKAKELLHIE